MIHLQNTDDQLARLHVIRYDTHIQALPGGLLMAHIAVVHPEGYPPDMCREVWFSLPAALQDDETTVRAKWVAAISGLRESYEFPVRLDIEEPLSIWRRGQSKIPPSIKSWVNEDSAPYNYGAAAPLIGG